MILCFIFYKSETTVVPKKSLGKLEISIVKRETAGKFVVEMMFSGEIYDKAFYQMILGKKTFACQKGDFEALVAELRPYIPPNPLSPNQRTLNAEKKVAITSYYLKDTASIGIVVNSFGVAICTVA